MMDLTTTDQSLTMYSVEVAELTAKAHKNVLADIRKMLEELQIQPAEFSARYQDAKGEARECFKLPKRECLILVSGYSVELRAKIIDRWIELEEQREVVVPEFSTLLEKTEASRSLIAAGNQQIAEIGRVIGGVTRNVEKVVEKKHGITMRALGIIVHEYLKPLLIKPLAKMDARLASVERRLDGVIDIAKRSTQPTSIVWTEWLDVPGIYAKAGLNPPKRAFLSQQVQRSIDAFCKSTHRQHHMSRLSFGGTATNVWHVVAVNAWLDQGGGLALIQAHIAKHSPKETA